MRLGSKTLRLTLLGTATLQLCLPGVLQAQTSSPTAASAPAAQASAPSQPAADPTAQPAVPASASSAAMVKKTYTVPAGTKVLLQLRSSLNTKSAKPGDGVYLASTFPVVVGNRVMIPAGVLCAGYGRPGCSCRPHDGEVPARHALYFDHLSQWLRGGSSRRGNSLPGASKQDVKRWGRNHRAGQGQGPECGKVAEIAVPTGATIGSIGGLSSGHPSAGGSAEDLGLGWPPLALLLCLRAAPTSISRPERRWRWCCKGR